jgi:Domain of unknown function (DUF4304)
MKPPAEQKFDYLIKEAFVDTLKPIGFKKKGNNFYVENNEIGKIINIQKSYYYSKEHIHFTINTGIFSPEFWTVCLNYRDLPIPSFPTEPECVIRKRIGTLLNSNDTWYDVLDTTNMEDLKRIMHYNVNDVILPYFDAINSNEDLLWQLDCGAWPESPVAKLVILAELKSLGKAKEELERLLLGNPRPNLKSIIIETGKRYGLA